MIRPSLLNTQIQAASYWFSPFGKPEEDAKGVVYHDRYSVFKPRNHGLCLIKALNFCFVDTAIEFERFLKNNPNVDPEQFDWNGVIMRHIEKSFPYYLLRAEAVQAIMHAIYTGAKRYCSDKMLRGLTKPLDMSLHRKVARYGFRFNKLVVATFRSQVILYSANAALEACLHLYIGVVDFYRVCRKQGWYVALTGSKLPRSVLLAAWRVALQAMLCAGSSAGNALGSTVNISVVAPLVAGLCEAAVDAAVSSFTGDTSPYNSLPRLT